MTTIDHRILIPAAPDVVWEYVSDITHNPDWQVDCQEVIFLTSRREGPGLRWRYATPAGHECVVAVTAWYNGLGYEYYYVDGVPYRENKGRIRLQEIPEGTIVQWTFTYELGGLLGGMRNALGTSRQVDHTIAESLKTLWQKVKQSGATAQPFEARSLMRDAPNVDARSAYQPRHPSVLQSGGEKQPLQPQSFLRPVNIEPPVSEDDGQRISVIAEPPIAKDDTRPRRPVTPVNEAEIIPPDIEGEPDFLNQVVDFDLSRFEPPRDPSDTQPRKPLEPVELVPEPIMLEEPAFEKLTPEESSSVTEAKLSPVVDETEPLAMPLPASLTPLVSTPEPNPETEQPTAPVIDAAEETQPNLEIAADEQATQPPTPLRIDDRTPIFKVTEPEPPAQSTPVTPAEPLKVELPPVAPPPQIPPALPAASIWEIFGVQRPSDTNPVASTALRERVPAPAPHEPDPPLAEPTPELKQELVLNVLQGIPLEFPRGSSRAGLRMVMRRKLVQVRRP